MPLTTPIPAHTNRANASPASTWVLSPSMVRAAMIAENVATLPTDRSMPSPPEMITMVWPIAMIPRKADTRSRLTIWP
jgi:hypothetical protein